MLRDPLTEIANSPFAIGEGGIQSIDKVSEERGSNQK